MVYVYFTVKYYDFKSLNVCFTKSLSQHLIIFIYIKSQLLLLEQIIHYFDFKLFYNLLC